MKVEQHFIRDFKKDLSLGEGLKLILTVKSFDLGAIRKRYVASRESKSGKVGSVERREPAIGGLVKVELGYGSIKGHKVLKELKEPRGIAKHKDVFAYSSENKVVIEKGEEHFELSNDWFSYIHALDISPFDPDRILISSSGLDCIFEYDLQTKEKTWEWFAWEHYKNDATDPATKETVYLTRNPEEHKRWSEEGKRVKFIDEPRPQYLPTAMRAAFINSVSYSRREQGKIVATLFHEGESILVDQSSNKTIDHLSGLSNPHGAWQFSDIDMISNTSTGEIVLKKGNLEQRFSLSELPYKHPEMEGKEWLQNSIMHDGLIISIDSNRTSLVIFDPEKKTYSQIPYNADWAVQDMVIE